MNMGALWCIAIVVFVALEAATYQLVSIWMAAGSVGAVIAFALGADFNVQFTFFAVVSIVLIILTRPLVKKFTSGRKLKTNVEDIPGKIAIVQSEINNISGKGTIKIGGMEWSARSTNGNVIPEGKTVEVVKIEGVKAVVKEV